MLDCKRPQDVLGHNSLTAIRTPMTAVGAEKDQDDQDAKRRKDRENKTPDLDQRLGARPRKKKHVKTFTWCINQRAVGNTVSQPPGPPGCFRNERKRSGPVCAEKQP